MPAAVVIVGLALVVAPATVATLLEGTGAYLRTARDVPGTAVSVADAVLRGIAGLAALVTLGTLTTRLVVEPTRRERRDLVVGTRWSRALLQRAAGVWTLSAAALILVDGLDTNGLTPSDLVDRGGLAFVLGTGDASRAWLVATVAGFLIWLLSAYVSHWAGTLFLAWAGLAGALAPVAVGQALVGPNHDIGLDAALLSTLVTHLALGTLLVETMRPREEPRLHAGSPWMRWSLAALVALELIGLWFTLAGSSPVGSATGVIVLARIAMLGGLLAISWRARTSSRRTPRRSIALLIVGLVSASATLTRIPPPQFFVPTSVQQILLGYDVTAPPSVRTLALEWRLNLLFTVLAATAVVGYLLALRVVRRRGDAWPWHRTAAWLGGWFVVVLATDSGLGHYSGPSFAVHMAVHMGLNMVAPMLLVLGGAITLAMRAMPARGRDEQAGPYEWIAIVLNSRVLHALYNPLLIFVVYIGSYYGLYLTGAFGDLMRFHWAHQLMNLHFLVVGYLYFGLIIGVDPTPRKLPSLGKLGYLMAAMPFHAFFGIIVMSGSTVIAEDYYRHLQLPWNPDLASVQRLAGGIAWAGSEVPLLLVVVVLALQWAFQDGREARRIDRRLDQGHDDSFDSYNAMLARLNGRPAEPSPAAPPASATTPRTPDQERL